MSDHGRGRLGDRARQNCDVLRWSVTGAAVQSLVLDVDAAAITNAATDADKLGIDCPLGWPDDFLVFLQEHHAGHVVAPQEVAGRDWRRKLAYRATDRAVRERTGLTPLSVAADRIGLTAMRAAGILSRLAAEGRPVDRAGNGIVVEVYPAGSLRCWGLPFRAYKGGKRRGAREALIGALLTRTPWLDLGAFVDLCTDSDDAVDAVIAALTSRAAAVSKTSSPDEAHLLQQARREGWIVLPEALSNHSRRPSTLRLTRPEVAWSSWSGLPPRDMVAFPRLDRMD